MVVFALYRVDVRTVSSIVLAGLCGINTLPAIRVIPLEKVFASCKTVYSTRGINMVDFV